MIFKKLQGKAMNSRDNAMLLCGFILGSTKEIPPIIQQAIDRTMSVFSPSSDGPKEGVEKAEILIPVRETEEEAGPEEQSAPKQKPKARLTPEQKEEICLRYDAGETSSALAIEYDCSCSHVGNILKAAGVEMRPSIAEIKRRKAAEKNNPISDDSESESPSPPEPEAITPEKPYVPVPAEKLISDHSEYAGKRDPGQPLEDTDWPDIDAMLNQRRMSISQVASAYDVQFGTMSSFIERMRRKTAPGEE